MTHLPLKIVDVHDRGVPNYERIVLTITEDTPLTNYFLGVGFARGLNHVLPINDNTFWFGAGVVNRGDWIFLYTGSGEPNSSKVPNQENEMYRLHWGRKGVLFSQEDIIPYLFEAVNIKLFQTPKTEISNALRQIG